MGRRNGNGRQLRKAGCTRVDGGDGKIAGAKSSGHAACIVGPTLLLVVLNGGKDQTPIICLVGLT